MCVYCKGTKTKEVIERYSVTLKDTVMVVNHVPSIECVQCGEKFYSDEVSKKLEEIYETAKKMDASIGEADYEKGPKSLRKVS